MAVYNVYLANLGKSTIDTDKVGLTLQGLFEQVIAVDKAYDGVVIQWVTTKPAILDHELLCYFVKDRKDSILVSMGAPKAGAKDKNDGLTFSTSGEWASEVYASKFKEHAALAANLAFHELMHNKAQMGDELHSKGGAGLAAAMINPSTKLSKKNIAFMAKHLSDTVKQWSGGFTAYNDPIRSL